MAPTPRPADFAGQAQHVEHLRLVRDHARREDRALPRARRELEPVEHREDLAQAVDSGQPVGGVDVLPREEAHEVGGAHRFDLRAQPVQRVTVNAREQGAVAPFEGDFAACAGFASRDGTRPPSLVAQVRPATSSGEAAPERALRPGRAEAGDSGLAIRPGSAGFERWPSGQPDGD